jgi:drug/metabolite transporter (DMT)-like permease
MQDTELFLSMAEIAGVFVGFGALISVRSGGPSDAADISYIRWLVAGLLALVLFMVMMAVGARTPENLAEIAATTATVPRAKLVLVAGPMFWLPMASIVLGLVLVVLGLFPDQEQAIYLTAVGFGLFMGAMTLLAMVFAPQRPQTASGPVAPPATGGSSA